MPRRRQAIAASHQQAPAGRDFVWFDDVLLDDEVMEVGHPVRQEPVQLGSLDQSFFGDGNFAEKFGVSLVVAFLQPVTVKFPEKTFAVGVMGMVDFKKNFQFLAPLFHAFQLPG